MCVLLLVSAAPVVNDTDSPGLFIDRGGEQQQGAVCTKQSLNQDDEVHVVLAADRDHRLHVYRRRWGGQ